MTQTTAILISLVSAGVSLAAAQQATFKGAVRTVAVYATVTQPGGRLVPDLHRDDFQVDDNGKAQQLTVFANEVQPITVVMMLDRSVSMPGPSRREAVVMNQLVEKTWLSPRLPDSAE